MGTEELGAEGALVPCTWEPELWFSDSLEGRLMAKRICGTCPVRDVCLEVGLAPIRPDSKSFLPILPHGIWGGFDQEERGNILRMRQAEEMRQARRRKRDGSYKGKVSA